MNTWLKSIVATGLIGFLAGCSSTLPSNDAYRGFLGGYDELTEQEASDGTAVMGWVSEDLKKRGYQSVMIDPVILYPAPKPNERLSRETLTKTLESFNKKLNKEVAKVMPVTDKAGPEVMRLRFAITTISAGFRDLRWFEYTPVTLTVASTGAAAGVRDEAVEVFVEAELLDSQSSERLAAVVRRGMGKDVGGSSEPIAIENIEPVLDEWSRSVAKGLDNLVR